MAVFLGSMPSMPFVAPAHYSAFDELCRRVLQLSSRLSPALAQALAHMVLNGMADDILPKPDLQGSGFDIATANGGEEALKAVLFRMIVLMDPALLRACCERCLNFLRRKYLDGQSLAPDDTLLSRVPDMKLFFLDPVTSTNLILSVQEDLLSVHGLLWSADGGKLSVRKHRQDILPAMPASAIHMPPAVGQLRASPRFQRALADAMVNWEALEADKAGIWVSAAVDFGVHRCTGATAPMDAGGEQSMWGTFPRYFRSINVYCTAGEYVLVDVRALPHLATPVPIIFHDDYGLAAHGKTEGQGGGMEAPTSVVKLSPRTQYTITADLRCFLQEACVLQHWLLLAFLPLATFLAAREEDCVRDLFLIGRRVTATVAAHTANLLTCLRPDAKPFYPERLRTLFDARPERFYFEQPAQGAAPQVPIAAFLQSGRISAAELSPLATHAIRVMLSAQGVKEAVRAGVGLSGNAQKPTKEVLLKQSTKALLHAYADASLLAEMEASVCPCALQTLVKFARLLMLEEKAMELDIKRHDLFYVPVIQTTISGQSDFLWKLEVKGLPEGRPAIVVGDPVYLRHASDPRLAGAECVAVARYVYMGGMVGSKGERPHALLSVPPDWLALAAGNATPHTIQVHARFAFDRSLLKNMYTAVFKAALAKAQLLPCVSPACHLPAKAAGRSQGHARMRFPTPLDVAPGPLDRVKLVNGQLNEEQRRVVADVLHISGHDRPLPPYVIFGPPGTGKTSVMVECVLQLLRGLPHSRMLVCAPSNFAADILCSGIGSTAPDADKWMIRLNDPRRTHASVKSDVRRFCLYDAASDRFLVPPSSELERMRVVVTTCGGAALLWQQDGYVDRIIGPQRAVRLPFTHVFVDEAGQALLPETLVPLVAAQAVVTHKEDDHDWPALKPGGVGHRGGGANSPMAAEVSSDAHSSKPAPPAPRVILCGDPLQLGPVVHSVMAASAGLSTSLLEAFMSPARIHTSFAPQATLGPSAPGALHSPTESNNGARHAHHTPSASGVAGSSIGAAGCGHSPLMVTKLVRNYRAHSHLLELPSRLFYKEELLASVDAESVRAPTGWEGMGGQEFPLLFYGVKGVAKRDGEAPSYFNSMEASVLVDLVAGLLASPKARMVPEDIGVMAPYRLQVQKLRLLFREIGLGAVRVGTVDDYQGQEERVIFISTVITSTPSLLNKRVSDKQDGLDGKRAPAKTVPTINHLAKLQEKVALVTTPASDDVTGSALDKDKAIQYAHRGFLDNPKKFNVAITRAKALLVVVGHPLVLLEDPHWRELLLFCAERGTCRGAHREEISRQLRERQYGMLPPSLDGALSDGWGGRVWYRGGAQPHADHGQNSADGHVKAPDAWSKRNATRDADTSRDEGDEGSDGGLGPDAKVNAMEERRHFEDTVEIIAEMSLLGAGYMDLMYPETLDATYAALSDDLEWRVVL